SLARFVRVFRRSLNKKELTEMKSLTKGALIFDFVVLVMGLSVPCMLNAADLQITDLIEPSITVSAVDFEFGFSVNGAQIQSGLGNPGSVTVDESHGALTFSGSWVDNGLTPTNSD